VVLLEVVVAGHIDGGWIETPTLTLTAVDGDGLIRSIDVFDRDERARALVRFDELVADHRRPPIPPVAGGAVRAPGAAERLQRRLASAIERRAGAEISDLLAADVEADDRRPGFRTVHRGRDAVDQLLRGVIEIGRTTRADVDTLATRGERLALARVDLHGEIDGGGPVVVGMLSLIESDTDEQVHRGTIFDPADVDEAFEILDERYASTLEDERRGAFDVVRALQRLYHGRDLGAIRDGFAPWFVTVDHRRASSGRLGLDRYLDLIGSMHQLAGGSRVRIEEVAAIEAWGGVARVRNAGTSVDGGAFELTSWSVAVVRGGRIERFEWFGADDRDAAVARFEELRPPGNAALHVVSLLAEAVDDRDAVRFAALHAPGTVIDDRRSVVGTGVRGPTPWEADDLVEALRVETELVAERGDRLALLRQRWHPSELEVNEVLVVVEADGAGEQLARTTLLDDDLDAAIGVLEERFLALSSPDRRRTIEVSLRLRHAVETSDPDLIAALFAPGAVVFDHRPARLGELPVAQWLEAWAGLAARAPDLRTTAVAQPVVTPTATLLHILGNGRWQGGPIDVDLWAVVEHGPAGINAFHLFDPGQQAEAFGWFDEADAAGPAPCTAAERVQRRLASVVERRAGDEVDALLAPDVEADDRRPGFRTVHRGAAAVGDILRGIIHVGRPTGVAVATVATRGERLALSRVELHGESDGGDPVVVEVLSLIETDETGDLVRRATTLEPTAVADAYAILDERFVEGLDPEHRRVAEILRDTLSAFNRRDLDGAAAGLAPGLVSVDHRAASGGEVRGEDYLALMRILFDLTTSQEGRVLDVVALEPWGAAVRTESRGATLDGGAFEVRMWCVGVIGPNGVERLEWFDEQAGAAAVTRLYELRPDPSAAARRRLAGNGVGIGDVGPPVDRSD
jgi:hypothetical protein